MLFSATHIIANLFPSTMVRQASVFCLLPLRLCRRYSFEVPLVLVLPPSLCLSQRLYVRVLLPDSHLLRGLPMPIYHTVFGVL